MDNNALLTVNDLKISFPYNDDRLQVVRGVAFKLAEGEILGILGESGSGKTVTATSIMGLTGYDGGTVEQGSVMYGDMDILRLTEKQVRKIRGREISYIFQNPVESLNPYRKIGKQLEEVQKIHGDKVSREAVIKMLLDLGLENAEMMYNMYPKQLSGGQCQRVSIAMALLGKARILIADEPTSSIDASMQGMVLELLKDVNARFGVSLMVITHNIEVVKNLCDSVMVMYGGLVMEKGSVQDVIENPMHPYTIELLNCARSMNDNERVLYTLDGRTPNPQELGEECPFYCRCGKRTDACASGIPEIKTFGNGREARCRML